MPRLALILAVLLPGLAAPAVGAEEDPTRLYLLHADSGFHYWSPDPAEPEASALGFSQGCSDYTGEVCVNASTSGFGNTVLFFPAALPEAPISWSNQSPFRFHLAVTVDSASPYTVHLVAQRGLATWQSTQAEEVAPGVWEGELGGSGTIAPGEGLILGVRIVQPEQVRTGLEMHVRTAGASWVDLPQAVPVVGTSDLLAASTYRPSPSQLLTEERALWFNDRDWESFSFEGDLAADETFTVPLERDATIVMGWVESVANPFFHGLLNGDDDPRQPFGTATARLLIDGGEIASDRFSAAAVGVGPGQLGLMIDTDPNSGAHPYRAHIVVIYGDRTLAGYRFRFDVPAVMLRTPVVSTYPEPAQPVPSTGEVTTFQVSLAADSPSPTPKAWQISFSIPELYVAGSGLAGTTSPYRVVVPGQRISEFSPSPASGTVMASPWDTAFEMEVRYAYTAPCPEDEPECEDEDP